MVLNSMEEAVNVLMEYFEDGNGAEVFNDVIEALDSYDGYLGDDRYYEMEMLDDFYSGTEPTEILMRAYFGGDDDGDGAFNPNRDYFHFNGYGNLMSSNYRDYSGHLDEYTVEQIIENMDEIDLESYSDELEEICDAIRELSGENYED